MEEWKVLHSWASNFRKENGLTILGFLDYIGAEKQSSFVQYLSNSKSLFIPSKREGTQGNILRTLLIQAKNKVELSTNEDSIDLSSAFEPSLYEKVESLAIEFVYEFYDVFPDCSLQIIDMTPMPTIGESNENTVYNVRIRARIVGYGLASQSCIFRIEFENFLRTNCDIPTIHVQMVGDFDVYEPAISYSTLS